LKTCKRIYPAIALLVIAGLLVVGMQMFLTATNPGGSTTSGALADFPHHLLELRGEMLVNLNSGQTIEVIRFHDIDLTSYPHLTMRAGFRVSRAEIASAGGDIIGVVVAVHTASGRGFVVERLNGTQGGYLFAPLDEAEKAIEYAKFMLHETSSSVYGRQYEEITSEEHFRQMLSRMEQRGGNLNFTLKFLAKPPANFTVAIQEEGRYEVSRVYHQSLETDRITWAVVFVWTDGEILLKSEETYVLGGPGARV